MSNKPTILFAEDEPALAMIVQESLESKGFKVIYCKDGLEAMVQFSKSLPDVLVLDVMMPKKDGFTLAKEIRQQNANIPILFLTAKSQSQDVVSGFKLGGNDYLKKPFSLEELIVRIENLLRTTPKLIQNEVTIGKFRFNCKRQELQFQNEKTLALTHREAHLLQALFEQRNQVLDRSEALKKLWNDDDFFSARSMDVFISKLRKKLSKDPNIQIVNVRGFGYKLIC